VILAAQISAAAALGFSSCKGLPPLEPHEVRRALNRAEVTKPWRMRQGCREDFGDPTRHLIVLSDPVSPREDVCVATRRDIAVNMLAGGDAQLAAAIAEWPVPAVRVVAFRPCAKAKPEHFRTELDVDEPTFAATVGPVLALLAAQAHAPEGVEVTLAQPATWDHVAAVRPETLDYVKGLPDGGADFVHAKGRVLFPTLIHFEVRTVNGSPHMTIRLEVQDQ